MGKGPLGIAPAAHPFDVSMVSEIFTYKNTGTGPACRNRITTEVPTSAPAALLPNYTILPQGNAGNHAEHQIDAEGS